MSNHGVNWVTVRCPVCDTVLGTKSKDEIVAFTCDSDGCSKTEHWYYPGQNKRPERSVPWAVYHADKKCNCGRH